jgi:hypothetical protein
MPRPSIAFALALTLLIGCGEQTLDQAIDGLETSFNAQDYPAVVAAAEPLLQRGQAEGAEPGRLWRIEKLRVQAVARQGQGEQATQHLERLAGAYASQVNAKLYAQIGTFVEGAGNDLEAISVYDAGAKRFPDAASLFRPQIEALKERATATGDSESLARLKSLGYL